MTQTMYAHVNKLIIIIKDKGIFWEISKSTLKQTNKQTKKPTFKI
jgi:hypothetical protein